MRPTRIILGLLLVTLAMLGAGMGRASADPIGPSCTGFGDTPDTCFGTVYTLEYTVVDSDTLRILYTADTSGTDSSRTDLEAIGFKIFSGSTDIGSVVLTPPAGTSWGTNASGGQVLNANGCNTNGGDGWVCSVADTAIAPLGGTYTWDFLVDYSGGSLLTAPGAASIKALFSPNGITSEPITLQPVPEPGTLLLVGAGLAGLGALGRKRIPKLGRRTG